MRFTASDRETGVRLGNLGTLTCIGQDRFMSVELDSGILANGDQLSPKAFQTNFSKADNALYPGSAAPAGEPVSIKSEAIAPAIAQQQTSIQQHDYGIGF